MTFTLVPINLKDAAGTTQPMGSYNDGTNNWLGHCIVDNTGALIAPATSGNQTTANTSLASIVTSTANIPAKGSATSANSLPVVIASDQAGLPLPTGASTSALQTSANTSLASIATNTGNIPAKGPNTSANSTPVVIANDQAALPLPTGASTSALQTTANTSLAAIASSVAAATPAGTNVMGKVGIDQTTPGTTNGVQVNGALPAGTNTIGGINNAANTSGGTSTYAALGGIGNALLTNSAVAVKSSAGNLYGVNFVNTGNAAAYVQFFDLASGSVTLGTTVPRLSFWVPAGGSWEEKFTGEAKISFATAITAAATTTATGNTVPGTGILANIIYK